MAAERRVVVLLDAVDQFEPTPRGKYITWFKPQAWPCNARIIATGIRCPATTELSRRTGIEGIELPPLTAADAEAIGKDVWGRYHRVLNPAVLYALAEKKVSDSESACGNPLWLTLALEQLNLLDADDFSRAEREFTGSPTERMLTLLLETAQRMPPDIASLYGWLLEQNEKAFGIAHARSFALAIALSRSGWRETDLLDLVPRLGHQIVPDETFGELSNLALASLRLGFRAHIVRRGDDGHLDFFHAQMRRAVLERYAQDGKARRSLHAAISDYLETLPDADPMIGLERISQLIGERNTLRAARYYSALDASYSDRIGATRNLAEWIASGESADGENPNLGWIISWLQQADLSVEEVYRLTFYFRLKLFKRMGNETTLLNQRHLIEGVRDALEILVSADPTNGTWLADLSDTFSRISEVLNFQGNLDDALEACMDSLKAAERLASADPSNATWQRGLSVSFDRVGEVLTDQGDLAGALRAYRNSLAIREHLASVDPSSDISLNHLGVSHERVGDVLSEQGDLEGAFRAYRDSLAIREHLASVDPSSDILQHELGAIYERVGDVLSEQGDLEGAFKAYRDSLAVVERQASADPSNLAWQRDLGVCYSKNADVLRDSRRPSRRPQILQGFVGNRRAPRFRRSLERRVAERP